jgi:hypothetical protein
MKSMTQLVFLVVFILLVTASIVFHKSQSAFAEGPVLIGTECVVVGDPLSLQIARDKCDMSAAPSCMASFIRPPGPRDENPPACICEAECWLCFGVDCG